jgi:hypothetical protein
MAWFNAEFKQWTINELYGGNIINVVPTKAPYENYWYEEKFFMKKWSPDRRTRFVGRNWFELCWSISSYNGIVTDVIEQDWVIYTMEDWGSIISIKTGCADWCGWCSDTLVEQWCISWSLATDPYSPTGLSQYKTSNCNYKKFFRTKAAKNKKCCDVVDIVNELIGGNIVSYVSSASGIDCISQWDYISTVAINPNDWTAWIWQTRVVTRIEGNKYYVDSQWAALTPPTVGSPIQKQNIGICIYADYWDVIGFVTDNWLKYVDWSNCWDNTMSTAFLGNAVGYWFSSTVVFDYEWQLGYINKDWYVYLWSFWFNNGLFLPQSTISSPGWFTTVIPYMNIVLLFGANRIGYLYRNNKQTVLWFPDTEYSNLIDGIWLFSRDSVTTYLDDIYILTNKKRLYAMWLWYQWWNTFGRSLYKPQFSDMSTYIKEDLDKLDSCAWDIVNLQRDADGIRVFITNNSILNQNSNDVNVTQNGTTWTKILFFNDFGKFWYSWIICWISIYAEKYGLWYWGGIWKNTWDTDYGNSIKQVVGMYVDSDTTVPKQLRWIFYNAWEESISTANNSVLKVFATLAWRTYVYGTNDISSNNYMQLISKNRISSPWELIEPEPLLMSLFSNESISAKETWDYHNKERVEFCKYEPAQNVVVPECDGDGGDYLDKPLEWVYDSRPYRSIAYTWKYGVVSYFPMAEWEVFYIELVADRGDRLHTNWFNLDINIFDVLSPAIEAV